MENNLRLILLAIGAVIIALIFLDGWRRKQKAQKQHELATVSSEDFAKDAAVIDDIVESQMAELASKDFNEEFKVEEFEQEIIVTSAADETMEARTGDKTQSNKTSVLNEEVITAKQSQPAMEIIALHILAKQDKTIVGKDLSHAAKWAGLTVGKNGIFNRYNQGNANFGVQFSLALAVEPGFFDMANLSSAEIPGVLLYMQLPGPTAPLIAFEEMLRVSRNLSSRLNAELCDEQRNELTVEKIEIMRDKVRSFERKYLTTKTNANAN